MIFQACKMRFGCSFMFVHNVSLFMRDARATSFKGERASAIYKACHAYQKKDNLHQLRTYPFITRQVEGVVVEL